MIAIERVDSPAFSKERREPDGPASLGGIKHMAGGRSGRGLCLHQQVRLLEIQEGVLFPSLAPFSYRMQYTMNFSLIRRGSVQINPLTLFDGKDGKRFRTPTGGRPFP